MFKIAILGCENSHANDFLQLIKEGNFPELNIIGVYSDEKETANALNEKFGIPVMENYDELVGKVDGIMITARHGDNHYKYAKPYLKSGIPMFIDKPITCSIKDAISFMQEASDFNVRLSGGSTLAGVELVKELADKVKNGEFGEIKAGTLYAPIQMDSAYGGFYFYAQHLVETMTTVFGEDVIEVFADKTEKALNVIARYKNFNVSATYLQHTYSYGISVFGEKEFKVSPITFDSSAFKHELSDMSALLKGEPMKKSYSSFIKPVFIMNAIMQSTISGKWEKINDINL